MKLVRRKFLHLASGAVAAGSYPGLAFALDYPTRPIMIVENLTGAAGSIGVTRVVRAPADGYTLSIGTLTTHVLIGGLYKLDFDLLNDLTPIAELAYEPLLICVKN